VSDGKKLNTKASGVIAMAVMLSRMLGLVREVLFNALFGTVWMGVFTVAFRIPNLLRDLFAEGALSTAFITVFSQKIEREGVQSAWALASKMMTLATVFMSAVTVLGILFAGPFVDVLAGGFKPEYKEMTILLTQIMFPFILLVSLAALVMGMLNSRGVFGVPALASSFFNLGSIAGGALCGWWIDPAFGERALIGLAIGTLVGGFLQLVVQLPSLRKVGFNFRPDFKWLDPDIRRILILMVPSAIAASAVQINVLVNTSFASHLGPAAISWLYSAFRLMQLPIGVFGVAVATITLPVISRIAANPDRSQFGPTLGKALRLAAFLTMPSAVGLFFLATPIISLIYEHREFKANDSLQTGLALQCYALGLVFYSGIKVLSPAFYAIDRKWTPMMVSFVSIGLNVILNYIFIFHMDLGHRGLALSTSISATVNFVFLYFLMRPHAPNFETGKLIITVVRCGIASAALGVICVIGLQQGAPYLNGPFWQKAVFLLTIIGAGAVAYMVTCWTLRIEEMHDAVNLVLRKIRRKKS
jgi:putative peptidoglycan lipid II flippase